MHKGQQVNSVKANKGMNSVKTSEISKPPRFKVFISKQEVIMTADSAATCNIIDEITYKQRLKGQIILLPSHNSIKPYSGKGIKPMGKFHILIRCANMTGRGEEISRKGHKPLLSFLLVDKLY